MTPYPLLERASAKNFKAERASSNICSFNISALITVPVRPRPVVVCVACVVDGCGYLVCSALCGCRCTWM